MNLRSKLLGLSASVALVPLSATAVTILEVPDAGQTLGSAQVLPGGTTAIQGNLGPGEADLFKFTWGGGAFYVNSVGTLWDSQLFLFDASGAGVQANDDGIAYAGPAYLQLAALAAGDYYLAISAYDLDPYSSSGVIFQSFPYGALYGPSNTDPLSYWAGGTGAGGDYTISFQQVTSEGKPIGSSTPVGVPDGGATVALLGLGLGGIGLARRKFQRK